MEKKKLFYASLNILFIIIILIWLDLSKIYDTLIIISQVPFTIFLIVVILLSIFFLRALRWGYLIPKEDSVFTNLKILHMTWFLNSILPARAGDISRIFTTRNIYDLDTSESLISTISDRVVDIVILFSLFIYSILIFNLEGLKLNTTSVLLISFGLLIMFVFIYLLTYKKEIFKNILIKFSILPQTFREKLTELVDLINAALLKVLDLEKIDILKIIGYSVIVWLAEASILFFIINALNYNIDPRIAIVAGLVGFISMIIPLSPGGYGTYEVAIGGTLSILSEIDFEAAVLIAFVDHIVRQLYFIILGLISFNQLKLNLGEKS